MRERYRENNYDCLRVYCMFTVILNHIADRFLVRTSTPDLLIYLCEGISHCAVPIFLMLTGAFLIDKMSDRSAKEFFQKQIKKIGIPFVFFMLTYWGWDYWKGTKSIFDIFETFFKGCQGDYAHWYIYMLIGVYALCPILAIIKENLEPKSYVKGAWLFFFMDYT